MTRILGFFLFSTYFSSIISLIAIVLYLINFISMEEEYNQVWNGLNHFDKPLTLDTALEYFEMSPFYRETMVGLEKNKKNPML